MKGFRILAGGLGLAAALSAQPALTTIQDILYRADGTRYDGTVRIKWHSFETGDQSQIATADVTVQVVNGVLRVRLAPTTNASPGANYEVEYASRGRLQFTETWAVPPASATLRLRDVRVGSGTVVGPPPAQTLIEIPDVNGLSGELLNRPMRGVGFVPARAAVINAAGMIDGASGEAADCVRVDGSAAPCGAGGGGGVLPFFMDGETPVGAINGLNQTFLLTYPPSPPESLELFRNGLLLRPGVDYTLNGAGISFFLVSTPQTGDSVLARYRYGDPGNPLGAFAAAQVACSGGGQAVSSATLATLGTCTIPAGVLGDGDRIEIRFQAAHTGVGTGAGVEVVWGSTALLSRSIAASESFLSGRVDVTVGSAASRWDSQSWGASTAFAAGAGAAPAPGSGSWTISVRGQMLGSTSETIGLSSLTVIRYPAQSNP